MHITIAAIGKTSNSPEESLTSAYIKRMKWKIAWNVNDGRKLKNKAEETAWLVEHTREAEKIFALDEHGKDFTSQQFSTLLSTLQESGIRRIAFMIGGADGLDKTQLPKHTQPICFGRMTWPHMLVRVMLAEQLYRAESILSGHPYHRE